MKGLAQHQPTVNRVLRVLVHGKTILPLCITDVQNNVSISIDLASIDTGRYLTMERTNKKLIAVVGATGQQGGAVVRALQTYTQFKVRALTRNPAKHGELGDEVEQATAAVRAAKDAGVKHFVWSTLPDVEAISGGKFHVPHFTDKAKVDRIVKEAGFANHTFVIAPFYYQNLVGVLA